MRSVLCTVTLAAALSGCQSRPPQLTPAQITVREELDHIQRTSFATDMVLDETPIIDIHTHTFNARYLPIEGVLLGKRDAKPPFSWLLSDRCAMTLAQTLYSLTDLAELGIDDAGRDIAQMRRQAQAGGPFCRILVNLVEKGLRNQLWNESMNRDQREAAMAATANQMTAVEKIALFTAVQMMGLDEALKGKSDFEQKLGLVRFIWNITQNERKMPQLFREGYLGVRHAGEPLMLSHMMDLEPVYRIRGGVTQTLPFDKQIARMQRLQDEAGGAMAFFVAYCPYRSNGAAGESPSPALRVVQDAIANHGAWGVKVYPPSGYRAAGNEIKDRPFALFTKYPGQEWDNRYPQGRAGAEFLDRQLAELLGWCRREDVPVFVHCSTDEFEARKGYGAYHSDPQFWRRYLETHPEPDGSPCRLRLCLGHAGGASYWFGTGEYAEWGRIVNELCTKYPNVYCEITTHEPMVKEDYRAYFVEHLARRFDASSAGRTPYRLADKLIYGTDWYLPDGKPRKDVLQATQLAFLHPSLRPYYGRYFFANAVRFLDVERRLNAANRPVPPVLREKFTSLAAKARAVEATPETTPGSGPKR